MMGIVFGFVLLVLGGAIVLLFAMFGELGSRVPQPDHSAKNKTVQPLDEARIGRTPDSWPAALSGLSTAESGILLLLSTTCSTCREVAQQLSSELTRGKADQIYVAVSASNSDAGEDFIQKQGLGRAPYFVDTSMDWVKNEFGVVISPSGLVFRNGRLESALLFQDLAALRRAAAKPDEARLRERRAA